MSSEIEVLEANEAFYRAFATRDPAAMEALWSRKSPVACIHPGWDVLEGHTSVLGSFRALMESAAAPSVGCSFAAAHVVGDSAFVTCHELISGARLVATNVFAREDGAWRMVHHHASPLAPAQARARRPEPEMRS